MSLNSTDATYMARAIRLAERGLYTTMPNPRVGCVLVLNDEIIGEGWHEMAGQAHAEINALAAAGESARGATAYVSLEPCSHKGKTGPCCEALVSAGVVRVVYGTEDPNPEVSGFGLMHLRNAGVEVSGPLMDDEARALNPGFNRRMERNLPLVRVKSAMSLDGRTAMASGESKWITTPHARADVQQYRARSCAVVSGIDTVLKDNASLTVRPAELNIEGAEAAAVKQPLRVILDSKLKLPMTCELVGACSPILLVHASADESLLKERPSHVELLSLPGPDGRIDLRKLLQELARRECNEVLVEAGATLSGSFLKKGLLDELVVYMAPKLMGSDARPLFDLPLQSMAAQLPLFISDVRAVGQDWRITARPDFDG